MCTSGLTSYALQISREFPSVDFSLLESDEDVWHDDSRRETIREVAERAQAFVRFLRSRPERNIAVVSHGVFLETLVGGLVLGVVDPRVSAERFRNCEMRAIVVGGWTVMPGSPNMPGRPALPTAALIRPHQRALAETSSDEDIPVTGAAAAGSMPDAAEADLSSAPASTTSIESAAASASSSSSPEMMESAALLLGAPLALSSAVLAESRPTPSFQAMTVASE